MQQTDTIDRALDVVLPQWRRREKIIRISTQGRSMLPLIQSTDRLSIRVMDPAKLKRGDVFAFRRYDGSVIVHRHAGKKKEKGQWFICEKGDNRQGFSWIGQEQVLGRVERIERSSGSVIDLCSRPWPWLNRALGWHAHQGVLLITVLRRLDGSLAGDLRKDRLRPADPLYKAVRKAGPALRLLWTGIPLLALRIFSESWKVEADKKQQPRRKV